MSRKRNVYRKKKVVQKLTRLTSEEPDPRPSSDIPLELDKVRSMAKSKLHGTSSEVVKHKTLARKLRKMVAQQMETIRAEMKQLEQTNSRYYHSQW